MRAYCRRGRRKVGERGAAAVEFALVVLPLVLIIGGVITYGFVLAQQASLSSGAREAARYGSVNLYAADHSCTEMIKRAKASAVTVGMAADQVTVEAAVGGAPVCAGGGPQPPCEGSNPDGSNTLTVRTTFSPTEFFPLLPVPSTLTGEGIYRCEYR